MTATTQTLADFLLARVCEDEAVARATDTPDFPFDLDGKSADEYTHIMRHNPARVLAECAAKRRIIELADEASGLDAQVDGEFGVGSRDTAVDPYVGDQILRALASVYADHEDFRAEWAL